MTWMPFQLYIESRIPSVSPDWDEYLSVPASPTDGQPESAFALLDYSHTVVGVGGGGELRFSMRTTVGCVVVYQIGSLAEGAEDYTWDTETELEVTTDYETVSIPDETGVIKTLRIVAVRPHPWT